MALTVEDFENEDAKGENSPNSGNSGGGMNILLWIIIGIVFLAAIGYVSGDINNTNVPTQSFSPNHDRANSFDQGNQRIKQYTVVVQSTPIYICCDVNGSYYSSGYVYNYGVVITPKSIAGGYAKLNVPIEGQMYDGVVSLSDLK